jgi:hypothetical protein
MNVADLKVARDLIEKLRDQSAADLNQALTLGDALIALSWVIELEPEMQWAFRGTCPIEMTVHWPLQIVGWSACGHPGHAGRCGRRPTSAGNMVHNGTGSEAAAGLERSVLLSVLNADFPSADDFVRAVIYKTTAQFGPPH